MENRASELEELRRQLEALLQSIALLQTANAPEAALAALRQQAVQIEAQISGSVVGGSVTLGVGSTFVGGDMNVNQIVLASSREIARLLRQTRNVPAETLQQLAEEYLRYLLDRHTYLSIKGMGISDRVLLKLPLLELYIPLRARQELPEGETWKRPSIGSGQSLAGHELDAKEQQVLTGRLGGPQPVLDLLRKNDGLIILGDPGAGKTTFLKFLALGLALGQDVGLGKRLPILASLSAYANALSERDHSAGSWRDVRLDDFIAGYFHDIGSDLPIGAMLEQALKQGAALVLLDGLDEVKDLALRHTVVERVVDFYTFHRRAGNKFVVTSRIVGYREVRPTAEGLTECTLIDFDDDEIEAFVGRWTVALEKQAQGETAVAHIDAEQERRELLEAIRRNPSVRGLAANPLLLTILALMKRQGVTLPERRVELYDQYVSTLLSSWNRARGLGRPPSRDLDVVQTVRVLAPLALWMHEQSPGVGLVRREDLRRELERIYTERGEVDAEAAAQRLIKDVREHAGLLLERGPAQYGFIHLTFEEYLSAVAVALRGQGDCCPIVEVLGAHIGDPTWREVSLLTVAYVGIKQQLDSVAGDVVEILAAERPGAPGEAVVLAGEAVLDAGASGVTLRSRQAVIGALVETMQNAEVLFRLRRRAGLVLGCLGWQPIDLDEFVRVLPARFLYGEEKQEREITYEYQIAQYPVTNVQYARFIEAGGYNEQQWWDEAGWKWKQGENRHYPSRWHDVEFGNPLCPVVGVSWFEAEAYCHWLTNELRQRGVIDARQIIRLPSEKEWERAARGTDGREYPWGDEPSFDCANVAQETGQGIGSSNVATFPQGQSPVGAWDMGGNVWEWTQSWLDEERKYRVLRGGSWLNDQWYARGAFRRRGAPGVLNYFLGFRVVLSLAASGSPDLLAQARAG